MTTLHIINAPQTAVTFATTLSRFCTNDSVIFIQDGCYSLNFADIITQSQQSSVAIYAIADDLTARKVKIDGLLQDLVMPIDYDAFVGLTLAHHKTISW